MRKLISLVGSVAVLCAAFSCPAAQDDSPYSSRKLLYAFLVLNEEGTKVLELVFDESEGTGKGYDTIYADVALDGDPANDKPVTGEVDGEGEFSICEFPPIEVGVPYNVKGEGTKTPWRIRITCYRFAPKRLFGLLKAQPSLDFSLEGEVSLRDKSGEWVYSFVKELHPSEKREGTLAVAFDGNVALTLDAKPDAEEPGNIGIAAVLTVGGIPLNYSRVNQYASAHVEIADEKGDTVHSEYVGPDKLTFG